MIMSRLPGSLSPSSIPIIFGLSVAAMIYAIGHISGAHFNPAVTLAFVVVRHFPKREMLTYWSAQSLGAGFAIGILHLILPEGASYGATVPIVTHAQAFIWEVVLTFTLMFVIIAVATDTRAEGTMAGAAIGAAVMLSAFVGGPITGASMNPARSLAPAIAEGKLEVLWIYIMGPMCGSVMAALLYEWIRCDEKKEIKKEAKGCC